jgi:hypothetical protein
VKAQWTQDQLPEADQTCKRRKNSDHLVPNNEPSLIFSLQIQTLKKTKAELDSLKQT